MTLLKANLSDFEILIGRLHPLVVHLPIGILLLVALFEWLSKQEKYAVLRPAVVKMAFWVCSAKKPKSAETNLLMAKQSNPRWCRNVAKSPA